MEKNFRIKQLDCNSSCLLYDGIKFHKEDYDLILTRNGIEVRDNHGSSDDCQQ